MHHSVIVEIDIAPVQGEQFTESKTGHDRDDECGLEPAAARNVEEQADLIDSGWPDLVPGHSGRGDQARHIAVDMVPPFSHRECPMESPVQVLDGRRS